MTSNIKVLHIISSLGQGGAERQLVEILKEEKSHFVCQLLPNNFYTKELSSKKNKIFHLNMRKQLPSITSLFKLFNIIKEVEPHIIHCWMYHSSFLELFIHKYSTIRNIPLIWGLRCSNMRLEYYSFRLKLIIKFCNIFSNTPNLIIHNSYEGKKFHDKLGFNDKSIVISNGINIRNFRKVKSQRALIRNRHKISDASKVFVCAARVDPMKDHDTLIKAFKITRNSHTNTYLLLAGEGTQQFKNIDGIIGLGPYENMNEIYSASDFIVSSSAFGEGFSNALGEGMANGLVPISTNVGDAKFIIDDIGKLVDTKNHKLLADSLVWGLKLNKNEYKKRSLKAKNRIRNYFSTEVMLKNYSNMYNKIIIDMKN